MPRKSLSDDSFHDTLTEAAGFLVSVSGARVVEEMGSAAIKRILLDLFCGKNLRDSTEPLTRRRLATLGLSLTKLLVEDAGRSSRSAEEVVRDAGRILGRPRLATDISWVARWLVGLTRKAGQNVLRDNPAAVDSYVAGYVDASRQAVAAWESQVGPLSGSIRVSSGETCPLDWLFLVYLTSAVGAGTLTIRGSDKSRYGKVFERLVLGCLLQILGFRYVPDGVTSSDKNVFWLSSSGEKRESDATVLAEAGRGARFDMGFIGPGNPEITTDKLTRFERQLELPGARWYMATVIIVDRIGPRSGVQRIAEQVGGSIVQMSMAYWPTQVAQLLREKLGHESTLASLPDAAVRDFLEKELQEVDVAVFCPPEQAERHSASKRTPRRPRAEKREREHE